MPMFTAQTTRVGGPSGLSFVTARADQSSLRLAKRLARPACHSVCVRVVAGGYSVAPQSRETAGVMTNLHTTVL